VSDGGYIACGIDGGNFFVANVDQNGESNWVRAYNMRIGEERISSRAYSIIETDDGNFLMGGIVIITIPE